ncbi:MAG: hypothetical protein KF796_04460 [Ramlibacter sp.]|nr:hypothetical protein [Ramlibacter sp.]
MLKEINFTERLASRYDFKDVGWRVRAAGDLGVSRNTFDRYFALAEQGDYQRIPLRVWEKLESIPQAITSKPSVRPPEADVLVYLFAAGLVGLQEHLDETGHIQAPYPAPLHAAFDVAAALNIQEGTDHPTNLAQLLTAARTPLYEWCPQFTKAGPAEFVDAQLLHEGQVTAQCLALGSRAQADPELPLYEKLMDACDSVGPAQAEDFYRAWRRLVIEKPFVLSRAELMDFDHQFLVHSRLVSELIDTFYVSVPVASLREPTVRLCPLTGTRLFRSGGQWCSEFRDPRAKQAIAGGKVAEKHVLEGMVEVRRAARTFWTLPGRHEVELASRIEALGYEVTLWPKLDAVDLLVESKDRKSRWAIDVKDYLSPRSLARAFEGFRSFRRANRVLVIPDYLRDRTPQYREVFDRVRKSNLSSKVDLLTVSQLMAELGE